MSEEILIIEDENPAPDQLVAVAVNDALAKANITAQVLTRLKTDYGSLTIKGIDDFAGQKMVEEARKECKRYRSLATKICKAGREDALRTQKGWIAKENEVTGEISRVEEHLEAELARIEKEKEQILFEAAQKRKLPERIAKLATVDVVIVVEDLLKQTDDEFNAVYLAAYEKILAEKAAKIKAEEDRIAAEKAEAERVASAKAAEEKRLKDLAAAKESARIAAEKKAADDIAKAEREKLEAEQKLKDALAKAEKDKLAAAAKAEQDKIAAAAKAERDKVAAIEKLKAEQAAKEAAEYARQESQRLADIEAQLSASDSDKFASVMTYLDGVKVELEKTKFKSKKYSKKMEYIIASITTMMSALK